MQPGIEQVCPLGGGGEGAHVELVQIGDTKLVLKRSTQRKAAAERLFQHTLAKAGLPSLAVTSHPHLRPDEILLEYVDGSTTIGGSPPLSLCERWGAAVAALHRIQSNRFESLDDTGRIVGANWTDFVDELIRRAIDTQRQRATDIAASFLQEAGVKLSALREFRPSSFALVHGDLHVNNALVRGDQIVLFDKSADMWFAPPVVDLALVHSEGFPSARYGVSRKGDDERLNSFLRAYGALPSDQERWLDHFVLAHSLLRYPSPFVPELRIVLETALERLSG